MIINNKKLGPWSCLVFGTALVSTPWQVSLAIDDDTRLEEILVTASKRSEGLQDVAMSVRSVDAQEIETRGLQNMADYLTSVPSVAFNERGGGRNQTTIRGITTSVAAADPNTVGYYFGPIPVSATARGNPDLKLFDVERVEILRGPQGTLYGSGSMGGTIKVLPTMARLNETEVHIESGVSQTQHGGTNYNLSGSVNLPLIEDVLALRIVAYGYEDEGNIDKVVRGATAFGIADDREENVASNTTNGGRVSLTWQASENLSINAMVIDQDVDVDGLAEVNPSVGKWSQIRMLDEQLNDEFSVYNLEANYTGEGYDVFASASFMNRQWNQLRDVTAFGLPFAPVASLYDATDEDLQVYEARISSNGSGRWQWLLGAFYLDKENEADQVLDALGNLKGPAPILQNTIDTDNDQTAFFGELSYQITDAIKATIGARSFDFETETVRTSAAGVSSIVKTDGDELTYKYAAEYTPDDDQLYYASATEGFRPGRANRVLPASCDADLAARGFSQAPDGTDPDSLWSYEIGTKHTVADGSVTINTAVYYIDWEDIPTGFLLPCGFSFGFNADTATSRGVEIEMSAQLTPSLRMDFGGAYTDSELDASFDPDTGALRNKGGETPGVPKTTFTLAGQYDFLLMNRWQSLLRVDAQYVGDYYNALPSETRRLKSGDYTVVNLRWSADFGPWNGELYATNLFDETVNIVVDTEIPDGRVYRGKPRTIGARVRFDF